MSKETQDKSIIRVQKNKDNPYTMINSTYVNDDRLSWKAKGLMTYFLTKPDDWKILICDLAKRSTDKKDAVSTGMKELISFGYVVKNQLRDEKGRMAGTEYIVYEVPINTSIEPKAENPETDNPETEKPKAENPETENPPLLIIDSSLPNIDNQSVSIDGQTDLQKIIEQCQFDLFDSDIQSVFTGVIEAMYYDKDGIKIKERLYPQNVVINRLHKITPESIELTLENIKQNPPKSKNSIAYYAAVLFNAITETRAEAITYDPVRGQ